jgi:hypothetical protein
MHHNIQNPRTNKGVGGFLAGYLPMSTSSSHYKEDRSLQKEKSLQTQTQTADLHAFYASNIILFSDIFVRNFTRAQPK